MTTRARAGQIAREVLRDGEATLRVGQVARAALLDSDADVRAGQLSRAALVDGPAPVRVGQVARLVLRSRRDSPYPNFPVRLFRPPTLTVRLEGAAQTGGPAPSGEVDIERMTAGGRWVVGFGETQVWSKVDVLAWRDFTAACDAAAMNCIVPIWDRRHQPFATTAYTGDTTFAQVIWRDTPLWDEDQVHASVAASTAKYATALPMTFAGGELVGGEHFSIYGPRYGWRLYRILRVETADGVTTAQIRPPLREWVEAGTKLNFDSPRCTMHCEGDISEVVELLRLGKGRASFVESFNRYP